MKKRYIVNLTEDERAALTEMTTRARVAGLIRQRARILLKADEGLTDEEIADDLEVNLVTVERVRKRCIERGIGAGHAEARRSGRAERGHGQGNARPGAAPRGMARAGNFEGG